MSQKILLAEFKLAPNSHVSLFGDLSKLVVPKVFITKSRQKCLEGRVTRFTRSHWCKHIHINHQSLSYSLQFCHQRKREETSRESVWPLLVVRRLEEGSQKRISISWKMWQDVIRSRCYKTPPGPIMLAWCSSRGGKDLLWHATSAVLWSGVIYISQTCILVV